jgi:glutaminyl-peptide cyclotransferase
MYKAHLLMILAEALLTILLVACQAAAPTNQAPSLPTTSSLTPARRSETPTAKPITASTVPAPPMLEPSSTPAAISSTMFDGQQAYDLVARQIEFGFRPTGSAASWATGDWIIDRLMDAGWETESQSFDYQGITARNIVGKSPGTEEKPIVILGAHYDTRRRADQDPLNPDKPVLGANDGASGTAVLLELALSLDLDRVPYDVWLAFFDAEDNGNLDGWDWIVGSTYMASQLTIDPEFVIVVDMVGDNHQEIYYDRNSDPDLMAKIWAVAAGLGYADAFIPAYRYAMLDDHTPFARLGIPAVDLIDFDYPYWHTTGDTIDKVDAQSLARVGRTLEAFLERSDTPGETHG